MLTFANDPSQKQKILAQLHAHAEADEIVKGVYWSEGKGCAVGCILHSGSHREFESRFNIPEWFARLIDGIFEGLPNSEAKEFPVKVWEAIPKGVDLEPIKWRFLSFLMEQNLKRVELLELDNEELKSEILSVIESTKKLWDNAVIELTPPTQDELSAAESAAESAAWSAAYSLYARKLIEFLKSYDQQKGADVFNRSTYE